MRTGGGKDTHSIRRGSLLDEPRGIGVVTEVCAGGEGVPQWGEASLVLQLKAKVVVLNEDFEDLLPVTLHHQMHHSSARGVEIRKKT